MDKILHRSNFFNFQTPPSFSFTDLSSQNVWNTFYDEFSYMTSRIIQYNSEEFNSMQFKIFMERALAEKNFSEWLKKIYRNNI